MRLPAWINKVIDRAGPGSPGGLELNLGLGAEMPPAFVGRDSSGIFK